MLSQTAALLVCPNRKADIQCHVIVTQTCAGAAIARAPRRPPTSAIYSSRVDPIMSGVGGGLVEREGPAPAFGRGGALFLVHFTLFNVAVYLR